MSDRRQGKPKWRSRVRRAAGLATVMAMTVVFGAWGVVDCADNRTAPAAQIEGCRAGDTDICTASAALSGNVQKKLGLTNRMLWVWANGTVFAFNVADHRAFFDWGYNLSTRNIRWINKSGMSRCLTPIGTCTVEYGVWRTETCDRSGPDTCLFRREGSTDVSFTYGVAFHRHLISCLGTRINWDGSHTRNTWAGNCSGAATATAASAKVGAGELVLGTGRRAISVGRYLARGQLDRLDRACLVIATASRRKCRRVALGIYRGLPERVQRKLAHEVGR
jgi:hypothetical protein